MELISFVIPCYRSQDTIEDVVLEIEQTMKTLTEYTHEIIMVNDSSPDDTYEVIKNICMKNSNCKGANFAKNFGQHAALMAGLRLSKGDIVVCLDDDGQTPADEVGKLLARLNEGSDVVYAKYLKKKHSAFRNFGSHVNEKMTEKLLGKPKDLYVSSYFAAKKFVVTDMIRYENSYPYVIGLVLRTTKNISNVEVNHREREVGHSGYTLGKLLGLWFNGFTAFSVKPLRFATMVGFVSAIIGFVYGIYTVVKRLIVPDIPAGFSALMAVLLCVGGMLMLMLGMVGEYVGRVYISLNNAPQYVIKEMINEEQ
jgi:undecaprenyl-phosphate 4-deoxy-4-formamido-L-arabinose transferase